MHGTSFVIATLLMMLGAEPTWPDLARLPAATGGGERDAAVVVAVGDYVFLPDIAGAVENGTDWYVYLTKVRKVPMVVFLRDGEATANKIRDAVEKATKRVKPGGRLWFVFIGHGAPSKDGKDGQLVGVTAQADEMDFYPHTVARGEVLSLAAGAAGAEKPILVLDACFSGTDIAGGSLIQGAQFVVPADIGESAKPEAIVLTAGRAKDIAGALPGAARPAFSYLLLGALRGWGDEDGDGTVTAREAVKYAAEALVVLEPGRMQEPQAAGPDGALMAGLTTGKLEQGPDLAELRMKLKGDGAGRKVGKSDTGSGDGDASGEGDSGAEGPGGDGRQEDGVGAPPSGHKPGAGASSSVYVTVEPGCFLMGSGPTEEGRQADEHPHSVCLTRGFYLKRTEVTQREWRELMGTQPSAFHACGDQCPVEGVSWWDAVAFCNALSRKEGLPECYQPAGCTGTPGKDFRCTEVTYSGPGCLGYRLPTEAEWEYAARAGSNTARYGEANEVAWYADNSGNSTHAVGEKRANAWGLHDMLGNAWEWCWDWYAAYEGEQTDPAGPTTGEYRVSRGAGWTDEGRHVRFAVRTRFDAAARYPHVGFRPARIR